MDDLSVSKGVFVHCKRQFGKPERKNASAKEKPYAKHKNENWYQAFSEICSTVDSTAANINANTFRQLLFDLKNFVVKIKNMPLLVDEIPTGILLAGINVPDHDLLLEKLRTELESATPYIATIWSRDAPILKNLIEEVVYQIINYSRDDNEIKRSSCTFCALSAWHKENNITDTPLVIIIPDFESFHSNILHDFILILSSYLKTIKFVLMFGVATTLHVVHRSLSYDATSKLKFQVFHTQNQIHRLSDVLDGIVLSPDIPFKITGRALEFLVDIFLWYDFSVDGFLKSYKICMWRHFYNNNASIICCKKGDISNFVAKLSTAEMQNIRKLPSVKNHLESIRKTKASDRRFKELMMDMLEVFHDYMSNFFIILRCLFKLSLNVPGSPFGKTFREVYVNAMGKVDLCERKEYQHFMKTITLFSKEEIIQHIESMLLILKDHESFPEEVTTSLEEHLNEIRNASLNVETVEEEDVPKNVNKSRLQFLENLKSKSEKSSLSPFKKAMINFQEYLSNEVFGVYLRHPHKVPIHEIFCFSDSDAVNSYIKGSTKASIYNNLNDPHYFFEKQDGKVCCTEDKQMSSMHPDINIVYSLHLENRKMINMYDWLQSFVYVVDPSRSEDDDDRDIDPVLQARFTRAVAELQFLGFVKATRKKTDHVKRLTA